MSIEKPKITASNVAVRLKKARVAAGFKSRRQFAAHIGMPVSTYCQYEGSQRQMRSQQLIFFCKKLNITPNYLLGWEDLPIIPPK